MNVEKTVFLSAAEQSTQDLMEKDSCFLTSLLRLVRDERKRTYNLLRVVNKGAALQPERFKAGQEEGAKKYQYWTRKAWVIENILRDRAGYCPSKITDSLLNTIREQMEQSNEKRMTINTK